jgi:hypothetical protein
MRGALAIVASLVLVGCGEVKHVDDTMNQQMNADPNYPPGPYGYVQGSTIQDIRFSGKVDPNGAGGSASYADLQMQPIALGDYHSDPNVKLLVLSGVAGWCQPCNGEQYYTRMLQPKYEPQGVRFFEAMIQGYDEMTGTPATEPDVNKWQHDHTLHVGIGLDPEDKIHEYADVAAFPLNLLVRTSDMKIVYMMLGEENLDSQIAMQLGQ